MIGRLNAQLNHLHRTIEAGDIQCIVNLRMNRNAFGRLCFLLINVGGLVESRYVRVEEKVAMFLSILAHHKKNRVIGHDYIRSGHTISAHFHEVMRALVKLHPLLLVKPVPVDETCTDENWKWFKGCLGALDGTHISVHVPSRDRPRYRTRKGTIAVNVMAVCDRNMNFVYALTGWEGSAADARVLRDALTRDDSFMVPRGYCYYLCDNGYANTEGFLTPYRQVRYHRDAWGSRASRPENYKELFNWRHSRARNVIERAFGLLKKRWAILRSPSFYPIAVQNMIILGCILLHNFIRSQMDDDPVEEVEQEVGSPVDNPEIEIINSVIPTIVSMDSGASSGSFVGRSKKTEKTRRSWTSREEDVLIQSLKDVVTKGWKSENGFKAGYLNVLESAMKESLPGCDLRGNPHINSKVHVWKKAYGTLVTILGRSGTGWNDIEKTIDATDETWEALIKDDASIRSMRHKQWTYYNDWCEIFGNDRAGGDTSKNFNQLLQDVLRLETNSIPIESLNADNEHFQYFEASADSISEAETPSSKPCPHSSTKNRKRKKVVELDDSIVTAINNLANITKDTMGDLVKQMAVEDKISDAQDVVFEGVQQMIELSEDEQMRASRLLFRNHDDLALFKRLGEKGRMCLVKRLLDEE
ncbi:uncharacterized protein [Henckelia pumila]|uniref:uncharacterized protein n=1 Tax=Henckelia pumila TaxID=405737 RepID=UPI003C6E1D7F